MEDEREAALANEVLASKAGREVEPGVVRAAVRWALARYAGKEAGKAAKARLHQLYGSYVEEGWLKAAGHALDALERGELPARDAALRLMALHGSTRERLGHVEECYGRIFQACGEPASVLDVACGLNPLSFALLGMPGVKLRALDAGSGVVGTLNRFFGPAGMADASAQAGDALAGLPEGRHDLALVMKFLPLAERIERGGALRLLKSIDAAHVVISFPTRSLGGRDVGMEKNYSEWFEGLAQDRRIAERFVCGGEVFYIIERP